MDIKASEKTFDVILFIGYQKLKITIASDLHFEFHKDGGERFVANMQPNDVLIIAGDLAPARIWSNIALKELCVKFEHVVMVLGNHEYYGSSYRDTWHLIERYKPKNLHVLEDSILELEGQRFVGSTLWFPDHSMLFARQHMLADFSQISDIHDWVVDVNAKSIEFLKDNVQKGDIVISHHIPSNRLIAKRYWRSPLNIYFASPGAEIVLQQEPKLWIFGHTHDMIHRTIHKTEMICNPLGYPGEHSSFVDDLVLEL